MKVTEINIYPIKSTRRIALVESEVMPRGLPWDRSWMLVDDEGKFITARQHPTLAVVEIQGRTVRPYHVGDSMILTSGQRGKIKLQTIAHSPVGYAVEAGFLDRDEAMHHEERHLISNMIGSEAMHITIGAPVKLADRDTLLVASDGLGDNLHLDEIVERIRRGPLAKVAERLRVDSITRMNSPPKGQPSKPDDMTFIVYRPRLDSGPRRCRPVDNRPRRTDATPPADQPLCLDAPAALGRD